MNRGVEIASEVADSKASLILDQVTNGVAVRMAVLYLLLGGGRVQRPHSRKHMPQALLIRGGRVIDPASRLERPEVASSIETPGTPSRPPARAPGRRRGVRCFRLVVASRLISMPARLQRPGREDKETIATGSQAAAAGGFTAVCAMPNTTPVNDSASTTRFIVETAKREALVRGTPSARSPADRRAKNSRSTAT